MDNEPWAVPVLITLRFLLDLLRLPYLLRLYIFLIPNGLIDTLPTFCRAQEPTMHSGDGDELSRLYDRLNLTGRVIRVGQHAVSGGCANVWEALLIPLGRNDSYFQDDDGVRVAVKVIREVASSASETSLRKVGFLDFPLSASVCRDEREQGLFRWHDLISMRDGKLCFNYGTRDESA